MDKTLNKFILCFVCLIIFDTLALDITFKKDKFGVFSAVANTLGQVYQLIKVVK